MSLMLFMVLFMAFLDGVIITDGAFITLGLLYIGDCILLRRKE